MVTKKLQKDIFEDEINGNAFAIMAVFNKQARREGWSPEEIEEVRKEATSGDYDHLIRTYMRHIA